MGATRREPGARAAHPHHGGTTLAGALGRRFRGQRGALRGGRAEVAGAAHGRSVEGARPANPSNTGANGAEGSRQRDRESRDELESAEKARALAQEQRELTERVSKLKDAAKALEEQLRQASALDTGLARQLREAQDLLKDALTADLLEQMRKRESATRDLSGEQARDARKNLAEMQRPARATRESADMLSGPRSRAR